MKEVFNPISTYRVQFNKDFTFTQFEKIIPYLDSLGVKTVYASPIFEATPGSTHGYDGTDPNSINPEIGTHEQLLQISAELKRRGMSWLQDIVPNHLSYHENTKWLMDVLDKGQSSEYADVFDIIWDHPDYPGRVMVPFPGSSLESMLKEKSPGEKNHVLCSWQETDFRMNYRRFFLVNTLICTNIHIDHVFHLYHRLIKELCEKDVFQGLRVDHIDGLYDPTKYLNDLRSLAGERSYIVVEKILEPNEDMPEYWPVQGNSGYDFLGIVNNLLTNRAAEYDLTAFYYDISGNGDSVEEQIRNKKTMILHKYMGGELDNLVRLYREVSGVPASEMTDEDLKTNIAGYLVACPVYRYYEQIPPMKIDEGKDLQHLRRFYERCMQFTGPLMAKGVEDTLMYTYNRFIGHNEVGDSPEFFGYESERFHELMRYRNEKWPLAMNSSSTHDTKRGEDVRARLNALTDMHAEWIQLVNSWQKENEKLRQNGAPDKNDEYFIYQTLIGSYPVTAPDGPDLVHRENYAARLKEYLEKSMREAKVHSTWTEQNSEYEEATIRFANNLIENSGDFLNSFLPFARKVTDYGMIYSFAQLVLKCTCPGVPDVYQGTELWDLSLVDPDNRRPVDYRLRAKMLENKANWSELWSARWDGNIKMRLLAQLLSFRNNHHELLAKGNYSPVNISGKYSDKCVAYIRSHNGKSVLVVVPVQYATITEYSDGEQLLAADWKDTRLEVDGSWNNVLAEREVEAKNGLLLNELFADLPVAVLVSGQ